MIGSDRLRPVVFLEEPKGRRRRGDLYSCNGRKSLGRRTGGRRRGREREKRRKMEMISPPAFKLLNPPRPSSTRPSN